MHVLSVVATVVGEAAAPYEPDTLALLEKAVALDVDVREMNEQDFAIVCRDSAVALFLLEPAHGAEALDSIKVRAPHVQVLVHMPML